MAHKLTITYESDDPERVAILHKLLGVLGSRRELRAGRVAGSVARGVRLGNQLPHYLSVRIAFGYLQNSLTSTLL